MPKYYCDYCDTYLTHDSPSVRKTHCNGRKHKENVKLYYQKWLEEQVQKLVDDTTAAFKAGKIASNPFQGNQQSGGAMIPPPVTLTAGKPVPKVVPVPPTTGPPAQVPVPGMSLMGPPPGIPPMMPVGMRQPMPHMGPPMAPMGAMVAPLQMRHPLVGGPPPNKMPRK